MMRRGGRGGNLPAPWRRHDGAIPSGVHLDRGWAARNYVKVVVLAACSIAISIMIWSLGRGRAAGPGGVGDHLGSRDSGFVFPLYRYYQQFPNGSHVVGGRGRWRSSRAGFHGRGIRSNDLNPLFDLRGGQRISNREIEQFYVEMKMGDPLKPFRFHIDTGSGPMWVYCTDAGDHRTMRNVGPNGHYVPGGDAYVKCIGAAASLCKALQACDEECDEKFNYLCLFSSHYADGSTYLGLVVNGSITLPMRDKTERTVFGVFGCVVTKSLKSLEALPLHTDGLIGLGNCEGTIVDQLSKSKAISQNVLGVCLAQGVPYWSRPRPTDSSAAPVGYISLGMNFEEKFNRRKSVWVKLTDPGPGILCAYAAKLLYISIHDKKIAIKSSFFGHETVGMTMMFDTGSDLTYFEKDVYDQVFYVLDNYAADRDYLRVPDNLIYVNSEQRTCWEIPATKSDKSPLDDFRSLKFGFEGIASGSEPAPVHYLIIQPANYLTWDEEHRKVCVNILEDRAVSGYSASNLGAEAMREHLFVFDVENERLRWTASTNCEISNQGRYSHHSRPSG